MLSSHSIGKIAHKFQAMKNRVDGIKEKAEETMGQVLQTAEIAAGAGGFAYLNARMGDIKNGNPTPELSVMGLPADLGTAVALHGLAFSGSLGKHKEHAHNLGDGALASYITRVGLRLGATARAKNPRTSTAGAFSEARGWQGSHYGQGVAAPWQGVG